MPRRRLAEKLISLRTQNGITLHAYVICAPAEPNIIERVSSKLCSCADESGLGYLPVILSTDLSTGGAIVREILRGHDGCREALELAKQALDRKDKFHLTIWGCLTDCTDDKKLMELH